MEVKSKTEELRNNNSEVRIKYLKMKSEKLETKINNWEVVNAEWKVGFENWKRDRIEMLEVRKNKNKKRLLLKNLWYIIGILSKKRLSWTKLNLLL